VPAPCPKCGGAVQENYRKFQCQKCDFSLWKVTSGREWSPEEVAELITKRYIGPLTGFRSRMGKPFAAGMRLNDEFRTEFDFGQGSASDNEEAPDFSKHERLGACPKCGAGVFEHGVAYVCEKSVGAQRSCDFRTGRIILQQPIERAQMKKLLATGRTDLLPRFISKKGRPFKAFLVKTPGGKIGFEFQPRAPKPGAAAKSAAPAAEVKQIRKEKPAPAAKAAKPPKRAKPPARKRRAA
jgi:DNA topoisomerase-3